MQISYKQDFTMLCTAVLQKKALFNLHGDSSVYSKSDDEDTQVKVGLIFEMFQVSQANIAADKSLTSRTHQKHFRLVSLMNLELTFFFFFKRKNNISI